MPKLDYSSFGAEGTGNKLDYSAFGAKSPEPAPSLPPAPPAPGYGVSNLTDTTSGKPLLTYSNEAMQSSQLLGRTAPGFDFTKPQKIDPTTLTNERMKQSVSSGLRDTLGATAKEQLDHIMPLELGGSNNKMNLRLEPTVSGVKTATDPIENQATRSALNGDISVLDAWRQVAKAKGITLEEDMKPPVVPEEGTKISQTPTPGPLQNAYNFVRNIFFGKDPVSVKAQAMNDYYLQTHPDATPIEMSPINKINAATENMSLAEKGISAFVVGSILTNPVTAIPALGQFMAIDKVIKTALSKATGKQINDFSDLAPAGAPQAGKDLLDVLGFLAEGWATHGLIKTEGNVLTKLTKDITTTYNLPKEVYIDGSKIKDIFQTGEKISPEELKMVQDLGLTGDQYKQAIKDGVRIAIPAEKIVTTADKPYWAKLKELLGVSSQEPIVERTTVGKTEKAPTGLLEAGKPTEPIPPEVPVAPITPPAKEIPAEAVKPLDYSKFAEEANLPPTKTEGISQFKGGSLEDIFAATRKPGMPGGTLPEELPKETLPKIDFSNSAELRDNFIKAQKERLPSKDIDTPSQEEILRDKFNKFVDKNEETIVKIDSLKKSVMPAAELKILKYSDGKYSVGIEGNTPTAGFLYGQNEHILYNSRQEAINAGIREIRDWTERELQRSDTVTDKKTLNKILKELPSEKKSALPQKEKVRTAVAEGPKSIKEVADQTKILEPNVRRILGVGAKEGTFERVSPGVYVLKDATGKENAYIEAGDAKDVLMRMVNEGKKFDSVILDPAYFSKALVGGNRGIKKYDFIDSTSFENVMSAVYNLVKSDDTHVYLMLSGAKTAQADMLKYAEAATKYLHISGEGFKLVGEGLYQKTFKDGSPVTNVRGEVAAPERILLFTKSGKAREGEIPTNLNFRFVRPSIRTSYPTEKPAELIKALIQQSTFKGESVLDPFAGSGVTGAEALKAGRKPTLVEKKPEVVENVIKPRMEGALPTKKGKQEFNIFKYGEKGKNYFEKVEGKKVEIVPWLDTFIHKGLDGGWIVSELKSGLALINKESTQARAIEVAKEKLGEVGEAKVKKLVETAVKNNGLSPSAKQLKTKLPTKELPEIPVKEAPKETSTVLRSGFDPGLDKFLEEDVKPRLGNMPSEVMKFLKGGITLLNPKAFVDNAKIDEIFKMKGARDKAEAILDLVTEKAEKSFDKMSQQENIDFIDRLKRGEKQPTPELQAIDDFIRKVNENLYDSIVQYKPDLNWMENHFRVLWKEVPGQPETKGFLGLFRRPLRGTMGFMGPASLEDMSAGIKAGGVPVTYNPITMTKLAFADGMKFVTAQRMWDNFLTTGTRQWLEWNKKMPEGFVELGDNIKRTASQEAPSGAGKGRWVVEEGSGRLLNNFLSRDLIRQTRGGRGLMWIKNSTTAAELSLSAFHWTFETIETMSSGMGLGFRKIWNLGLIKGDIGKIAEGLKEIITSPITPKSTFLAGRRTLDFMRDRETFLKSEQGKKFIKQFPDAPRLMDDFFNGGGKLKMSRDYEIGTAKTFMNNLNNGNYIGAAIRSIPALNETLMKPLFNTYIPALKIGMFMREFPIRLLEKADDLASGKVTRVQLARDTVDFVENRLGEMNFDNLMWNRTFKTALQLLFRSVTWKLGNIRAFGEAFKGQAAEFWNAAKEGRTPQVTPEGAWMTALIINTAIIATLVMKMYSGKYPQTIKDLVYPQSDPNDPKQRMSLPTYLRDAFSLAHSPVAYIGSSMSGEIGKFLEVLHNADFYNTEIYNVNDPLTTKIGKIGLHLAPLPFSVQNLIQPNQNIGRKIGGFIGLTKAPAYISETPIQTTIYGLYQTRFGGGTQTQESADAAKMKSQIRNAYIDGKTDEANKLLADAISKGYIKPTGADTFIKNADIPGDVRAFSRFDATDQEDLFKKMDMSDLLRYAWEAKPEVKAHFSNISPDTKQFVDDLNAGKIKPVKWVKGEAQ